MTTKFEMYKDANLEILQASEDVTVENDRTTGNTLVVLPDDTEFKFRDPKRDTYRIRDKASKNRAVVFREDKKFTFSVNRGMGKIIFDRFGNQMGRIVYLGKG